MKITASLSAPLTQSKGSFLGSLIFEYVMAQVTVYMGDNSVFLQFISFIFFIEPGF